MPDPLPCDREESDDLSLLRAKLEQYKELEELCYDSTRGPLDPEDQEELDRLYADLLFEEQVRWESQTYISPMVVETVRDIADEKNGIEFPYVTFLLGLYPGQNNNRSFE